MKLLKRLAIAAVALLAAIFLGALLLPATVTVERSIEIDADRQQVFDLVADHRAFHRWSPWAAIDPNMVVSYEGPARGLGSKMSWRSAKPEAGAGSSVFTEYQPPVRAATRLEFEGMGSADASYALEALGEGRTRLTWGFSSTSESLLNRYFGLMMDRWVGADYEKGLAALKQLAESLPPPEAIVGKEINYQVDGVALTGYLAQPPHAEQAPGILVVHEWWGHNAYARKRADMLAELGYVALALDMYGDGKLAEHPEQAQGFMMEVVGSPETLAARFDAALALLRQQPGVDQQRLAAIGYCFGGGVALSMARSGRPLRGAVSFHGVLQGLAPIAEGVRTPLLVLNGAEDPFVPAEQKAAFRAEMDASDMPYSLVDFPGAKHSFTNPEASAVGARFDLPLAYDAAADQGSWRAMQAFFTEIFADEGAGN